MSTASAPASTPAKQKRSPALTVLRRLVIATVLVVLILVPTVVLLAITHQPSATWASMGAIVGLVAVVFGGLEVGIITAVVLALLAPVAIVAGLTPITGAALMALMTLMVGRMARFGLNRALMLVPIFVAWPMLAPVPWLPSSVLDLVKHRIDTKGVKLDAWGTLFQGSTPHHAGRMHEIATLVLKYNRLDHTYLAWTAVFFFVGTMFMVVVGHLASRKLHLPATTVSRTRREVIPYTVTITVLASVGTYWFLDHPKQTAGAFFIATVLVLSQVGEVSELRLTLERVAGTIGGALLMMLIVTQVHSVSLVEVFGCPLPVQMVVLGAVFGVLAVTARFGRHQWIYYALIVPTTACLNGMTVKQASDVGTQRVIDNLVGAGLILIVMGITVVSAHIAGRKASDGTSDGQMSASVVPAAAGSQGGTSSS